MNKMVYFDAEPTKVGVLLFARKYVSKRLFRKERFECSITPCAIEGMTVAEAYDHIAWFYPDALIWDNFDVEINMATHKHWLITKNDGDSQLWFSHTVKGEAVWTDDINDAELQLDLQGAETFANDLRQRGEKISVCAVYLNRQNKLLTPSFIITCTSRKSGVTKFFARYEDGRIRLVKTSDSAKRFSLGDAQSVFESLRCNNKSFSYSVIPAFKDNVNCSDLGTMISSGQVPLAVETTTKLKWLNR